MCHFHSICVRRDGAIAHIPGNSHSSAAQAAGWRENDQMADMRGAFFVEAEWPCEGEYPGAEKISRSDLTEKQRKAIDDHYRSLAELLADPAKHAESRCFGTGRFAGPDYADVRSRIFVHPDCPKWFAEKFVETELWLSGGEAVTIQSLHPKITKIHGSVRIADGVKIDAKNLTEVSGSVDVHQGATFTAPALTKSGYVYVQQGATFTAPALTEVSSSVDVQQGATFTAPALTEVSGSVDVHQGATFTAPALTEVSGYVKVHAEGKLDAPKLKKGGAK